MVQVFSQFLHVCRVCVKYLVCAFDDKVVFGSQHLIFHLFLMMVHNQVNYSKLLRDLVLFVQIDLVNLHLFLLVCLRTMDEVSLYHGAVAGHILLRLVIQPDEPQLLDQTFDSL